MISRESDGDTTVGALADRFEQTTERIIDALDVLKIREGVPTQQPPVPWHDRQCDPVAYCGRSRVHAAHGWMVGRKRYRCAGQRITDVITS